jgi:hypothetical protein
MLDMRVPGLIGACKEDVLQQVLWTGRRSSESDPNSSHDAAGGTRQGCVLLLSTCVLLGVSFPDVNLTLEVRLTAGEDRLANQRRQLTYPQICGVEFDCPRVGPSDVECLTTIFVEVSAETSVVSVRICNQYVSMSPSPKISVRICPFAPKII